MAFTIFYFALTIFELNALSSSQSCYFGPVLYWISISQLSRWESNNSFVNVIVSLRRIPWLTLLEYMTNQWITWWIRTNWLVTVVCVCQLWRIESSQVMTRFKIVKSILLKWKFLVKLMHFLYIRVKIKLMFLLFQKIK